jgi:hypothetical protein
MTWTPAERADLIVYLRWRISELCALKPQTDGGWVSLRHAITDLERDLERVVDIRPMQQMVIH